MIMVRAKGLNHEISYYKVIEFYTEISVIPFCARFYKAKRNPTGDECITLVYFTDLSFNGVS